MGNSTLVPSLMLVGWAIGLVVTALVVWSPHVLFGYYGPSMHLVLDTVDACVALLVAYLLHGRFTRRRRLQDLLLAQGLILLAVAGIGLTYAAESLDGSHGGSLDVWLPLAVRTAGAAFIAGAALVSPAREVPVASWWWAVVVPVAFVVVISLALWAGGPLLPTPLGPTDGNGALQPPILSGHPLLLTAQGAAAACFFVASIAFTSRALSRADPLLHWLGPACALAAFARVNYALFPSLYTDWIYTGDILRTGFYLFLLIGASREIEQYWDARSRAAVLEDRRRLARELHDSVIQELALIRMEGHALPADEPTRGRILGACDRALDEVRVAVQALGTAADEPLGFVLHRAARELAQRYRVHLEVDVDDSIDAGPEQQHALLRIVQEAVSNAVRHGRAEKLCLRLARNGDGRRLVVKDDGAGFDVRRATGTDAGYGLISMRERAGSLPGALEVCSEPGRGSEVTVTW
ncbi:hypothetical protein GCM10009767_24830 [Kocuria aegyptia]|uniref:Histidine kinase domain-containing protein n=1 Tax=Kocuria aegyptia TaxID=330943 RepID=A0ABN2KST6_9MICC